MPMRLSLCEKCGSPKENHRACAACGFYKGREVVNVMKRAEKKAKAKKGHTHEHSSKKNEGEAKKK